MAFANSNVTDLMATGIEHRNREIADNVLLHNPVTASLKVKGRTKTFDGGHKIYEELSFAENTNGGAFSGYDILPVAPTQELSAAEYEFRQYAVPVIVSGRELLQNAGREKIIDLVDAKLQVAEDTMANLLEAGAYGDGTGYGGKAIDGLGKYVQAVATASQSSTIGSIAQGTWSFWRSYYATADYSSSTDYYAALRNAMNTAYAGTTRGNDQPDLVIAGSTMWVRFLNSMQSQLRFSSPTVADLGFPTVKYMNSDVVLGGGIGGLVDALDMFFLNTKYLRWRPHSACNMVPLAPTRRYAVNMDAQVQILAFAGNMTARGLQFQGRIRSSA